MTRTPNSDKQSSKRAAALRETCHNQGLVKRNQTHALKAQGAGHGIWLNEFVVTVPVPVAAAVAASAQAAVAATAWRAAVSGVPPCGSSVPGVLPARHFFSVSGERPCERGEERDRKGNVNNTQRRGKCLRIFLKKTGEHPIKAAAR